MPAIAVGLLRMRQLTLRYCRQASSHIDLHCLSVLGSSQNQGFHLGHRAFETNEQRVGHQRMADVQLVDTFDCGHGLDVAGQEARIKAAVERLSRIGSEVSLFIDADERQIEASRRVGAPAIELHTGRYADATTPTEVADELQRIIDGVNCGLNEGLIVNAGHGLHYHNVEAVAAIKGINELNIGHALVAHALFVGFKGAVAEMKALILAAAKH